MNNNYRLYKGFWVYAGQPHDETALDDSQFKSVLSGGGIGVRNSYNFDKHESGNFWYVICDSFIPIENVPSPKVRNQIRKSLKTFNITLIDRDYLKSNGYRVLCAASTRYGNYKLQDEQDFINQIDSLSEDCDIWGCIRKENGQLDAYAINYRFSECVDYSSMKADLDSTKGMYPFYGLIHLMNEYYLSQHKYKYVYDGARSITEHSNIQPFLIDKFGFRCAYADLKIQYRFPIGIAVKAMFPFRKIIPIKRLQALLKMEEMTRNKKKAIK